MDTLAGMTRTGNKVSGPGSDLVELVDVKGLKHLAITFHRRFRDHSALGTALNDVMPFLEQPDVCDLLELVVREPEAGAFLYPTGTVVALADVLESLRRMRQPAGVRAGLELCYNVAQILQDAYVKAERHGLYNHGDLSPWRIVFKPDGQTRVIGFGLPQIDVIAARESERANPKEDTYRYCPPERIEGEEEDFTSDLYSLALMAFEMMVGEPLFQGTLSDIKQLALNAQGPYRLYQYRDRLPESVGELLSRSLKFDMDTRHKDINEFIWEVRDLLALPEIDGPSLAEVCGRVVARLERLKAGEVEPVVHQEVEDVSESEDTEAQAARWAKVQRSGGKEKRAADPDERSVMRDRLRRPPGATQPSAAPALDAKASLKERLQRSRAVSNEPAPASTTPAPIPPRSVAPQEEAVATSPPPPVSASGGRAASLLERLRSSRPREERTEAVSPPPQSSPSPDAPAPPPAGRTACTVRVHGVGDVVVTAPSSDEDASAFVQRVLARCGGPRASLLGLPQAWYSLSVDGRRIGGGDLVPEIGPTAALTVDETAAITIDVVVEVQGGPSVTLTLAVSTALTVGALMGAALRMVGESPQGWRVEMDGSLISASRYIGDVVTQSSQSLVVCR
jgi:hypothetical protein